MATFIAGIDEKLRRAKAHITHVHHEVEAFLGAASERVLTDSDPLSREAFSREHQSRDVPTRVSVVVGEIVYQLRSSLDHLTSALILHDGGRLTTESQFPIFQYKPTTRDDIGRYQRQVNGIQRGEVLALIEAAQPYHAGGNRDRHPLAVLKALSNTDKHRTLLLHRAFARRGFRFELAPHWAMEASNEELGLSEDAEVLPSVPVFHESVEVLSATRQVTREVTFAEFGPDWKDKEIRSGLRFLFNNVFEVVMRLRIHL